MRRLNRHASVFARSHTGQLVSFGLVRISLRTGYSFGIVRFRSRSKSEPNEDGHTKKLGSSHRKWDTFGGRNGLVIRLPVRPVASLPRVPELSFVSCRVRSGRSCKPGSTRKWPGRNISSNCSGPGFLIPIAALTHVPVGPKVLLVLIRRLSLEIAIGMG